MTQDDYHNYIHKAIFSYESELIISGRFQNEDMAHQYAVEEYHDIFKYGFHTPDIYLFNIIVNQ